MSVGRFPESEVWTGLQLGVAALKADATLLDRMFGNLSTADKARVRSYWAQHELEVIRGYPVLGTHAFPCVGMVLGEERPEVEFLAYGLPDDGDVELKGEVSRETVTLYVYAESAEACAWYYRIVRVLAQMVKDRLLKLEFQLVTVTGAELMPSPEMGPNPIFVRRVTLSCAYLDVWDAEGDLYEAIVGAPGASVPVDADVLLRHEDAGGGVTPYEE